MTEESITSENRKKDEENFTVKEKIEDRQNKVFELGLRGLTNQEICDKLGVSLSTVEKDRHEIKNNCLKWYKQFKSTGVTQSFQDVCGQVDLILKELWKSYENEKSPTIRLKILDSIYKNLGKKIEVYGITPKILPIIEKEKK